MISGVVPSQPRSPSADQRRPVVAIGLALVAAGLVVCLAASPRWTAIAFPLLWVAVALTADRRSLPVRVVFGFVSAVAIVILGCAFREVVLAQ